MWCLVYFLLRILRTCLFEINCRYSPKYVKEYIEGSKPMFSVGEYWDNCEYSPTDCSLNYNQGSNNCNKQKSIAQQYYSFLM